MPEWISSAIGAGSSLLNQLFNRIFGLSTAEREQNEFNAFEAQKSRDWQESLFQQGNQFNAEQAQLNRDFQASQYQTAVKDMRAAGINPALAVGGVSGLSGASATAASAPGSAQASGSGRGIQSSLSEMLQGAMFAKDLQMKNAEIKRMESESFVNEMNAKLASTNAQYREKELGVFDRMNELQQAQYESALKSDDVQRRLHEAGISETEARRALEANQAVLAGIDAKTRFQLSMANIRLINAEAGLAYENTRVARESVEKVRAEINELYQRSILHAAQAGMYDQQTTNLLVEEGILRWNEKAKEFEVNHQNADRTWRIVGQVVNNAASVAGAAGSFIGGFGVYKSGLSALMKAKVPAGMPQQQLWLPRSTSEFGTNFVH